MENMTTTKEDYHNIPNELLQLPVPSMPDTDEPDVILAGGEQRKSGVKQLRKLHLT